MEVSLLTCGAAAHLGRLPEFWIVWLLPHYDPKTRARCRLLSQVHHAMDPTFILCNDLARYYQKTWQTHKTSRYLLEILLSLKQPRMLTTGHWGFSRPDPSPMPKIVSIRFFHRLDDTNGSDSEFGWWMVDVDYRYRLYLMVNAAYSPPTTSWTLVINEAHDIRYGLYTKGGDELYPNSDILNQFISEIFGLSGTEESLYRAANVLHNGMGRGSARWLTMFNMH